MIRVGGLPGKKILETSFQSKPGFGGVHLSSQLRGDIGGSQFKQAQTYSKALSQK
jgi:hypothetical protein